MKQLFAVLFVVILVLGFSSQAQADLELRGTDNQGNRLIYDTDFNITWYDYTRTYDTWQTQMNWASALSVSGGDLVGVYDDWRLPTTVDGPYVRGYDGTTTGGYNITSSEMGHLFYTELGNKGYYDTSGNPTACYNSWHCLTHTGDFQHLQTTLYWSGTEYSAYPSFAWHFGTHDGYQDYVNKTNTYYAIAVRPGDVAVVPEPISSILFVIGGATLIGRKYIRRKKS